MLSKMASHKGIKGAHFALSNNTFSLSLFSQIMRVHKNLSVGQELP